MSQVSVSEWMLKWQVFWMPITSENNEVIAQVHDFMWNVRKTDYSRKDKS
jgi:hypothetical protein